MEGSFRESPRHLNQGVGQPDICDKFAIRNRAAPLAQRRWESVLGRRFRPRHSRRTRRAAQKSRYTIADHPNLFRSERRRGFERIRDEAVSFAPFVSLDFLKERLAFRTEATFLDVVPQASRLLLVLNIPITALHNERRIVRDVSGLGHSGIRESVTNRSFATTRRTSAAYAASSRQAYEYQLSDD
ncbi:hypothetical protein [Curtobacterium sp. MR_MD2014]|uniref:hypothetical protein n=1 Tax=Curtobacterium sp. MR_MD2014 TaxID=1561023 RepID=UPI00052A5AEA|nr:hypothetical protein [Curtobacterium sp. MR_MD2014]AIV39856.1 hypothetical protein NI26_05905 [Curtobacterium sp. MR_MD2014]